jgi:Tol biopolymer transport system component
VGAFENSPTVTSPAGLRHDHRGQATAAGVILGTAPYMSPEQARGRPVDKRADIWAFGCVLYEMLSGRRLFGGESITEVLAAVIKDTPDWSALPDATPAGVRHVLARCLERDVRRRLHDIADARIEIEDAIASPGHEPAASEARPAPARRLGRREIAAWAAAGLLAVAAVVLGLRPGASVPDPPRPARVSLIHRGTTIVGPPEISPDGRHVAYVARNQEGLWQIWVRDLDAPAPRPLAFTDDFYAFAIQPFWSADSRDIGFLADRGLRRVSASGGAVEVIAGGVATAYTYGGAWSANGTLVYSPRDLAGLMRVAAEGGPATPQTTLPGDGVWVHMWPSFLPDGRRFLFTAAAFNRPREESRAGIYLGSLDSTDTVRLLPDVSNAVYAEAGYLLFARDGVLNAVPFDAVQGRVTGDAVSLGETVTVHSETQRAAFSVSRTNVIALRRSAPLENVGQLQLTDRRGAVIATLGGVRPYADRAVSPDGRWIAATVVDSSSGSSDIWILGTDGSERRLTSSREFENAPVWSPDGTRIAHLTTNADGSTGVHVSRLDGTDPLVLIEWREPGLMVPGAWSPDGRHLLLCRVAVPDRPPDAWLWSFDTKSLTPLTDALASACGGAKFSPDGRWVAYGSQDSGTMVTFVTRFPTPGERKRIATGAGPISWRADGREILLMTSTSDLVAVPITLLGDQVSAGDPTVLMRRLDDLVWATPDHSRLVVLSRPDPEQGVAEIQLLTGWQEKLR